MAEFLFIAQFRRGRGALCKVKIVKETPKTYMIRGAYGERKSLIGTMFLPHRRLLKDDSGLRSFKSGEDALAYLIREAEKWVVTSQENLAKAQEQCSKLSRLIGYIEDGDGKQED